MSPGPYRGCNIEISAPVKTITHGFKQDMFYQNSEFFKWKDFYFIFVPRTLNERF